MLMFPWLAHGHTSPFLELSKKLIAKENFYIYFCSTPAILNTIKPKITSSPKYSNSIRLVELHLPPLLPPHYHTTNGLPPHLMNTLKKAFDMSAPRFYEILKNLRPNLVIYDFIQPWAPSLALSLNIPAVHFMVSSATMVCFVMHLIKHPDEEFPFSGIFIHDYMNSKLRQMLENSANGTQDRIRVSQCFERSCKDVILIKTFRELEEKFIDYSSSLLNKKMIHVGPLVQDPGYDDHHNHATMEIIRWLDKKERFSTVFLSFGSEYFLSKEEILEIAHGLELIVRDQINFIWVVRFPNGEDTNLKEALPENFIEKVGENGKVVENWAPQMVILGHEGVGGFASHCGWSSVMESMKVGVPIIGMPMHLDQPLNARLVEEVGVGIEVRRNKTGRFEREEIAKVVKEVITGESSEKVRKKAKEMSENIRRKGDAEIDEVVSQLVRICGD